MQIKLREERISMHNNIR